MYFSVKHASFSGFRDCFKTKCYNQCKGKKFVIIIILYICIADLKILMSKTLSVSRER